jgi:hypothetical protein
VNAVIFVPQTEHSGLAKTLRENEEEMLKVTGYKLKIVERAGKRLTSMLTKSNPWGGYDCGRSVYETWCADCLDKKVDVPWK